MLQVLGHISGPPTRWFVSRLLMTTFVFLFLALLLPGLRRFLNVHFLSSARKIDFKHVSIEHKPAHAFDRFGGAFGVLIIRRSQSPG
jgi:hypothetical protein